MDFNGSTRNTDLNGRIFLRDWNHSYCIWAHNEGYITSLFINFVWQHFLFFLGIFHIIFILGIVFQGILCDFISTEDVYFKYYIRFFILPAMERVIL